MNLTIRHLVTFREVMLSGSMSEAGRALGRTQPAISAMLSSLEQELGYELFRRDQRRLVPSPEAHYFLEEVELILNRLAQSGRTMREIGNLKRGTLRIACNPASSNVVVPNVVARFLQGRDDVKVSLMMRSSIIVEEWVASQKYDIGIAETPQPRRALDIRTFNMRCVCAVSNHDPLASREVIRPVDLDGLPMAALFDEHHTHSATFASFQAHNAVFNQRFELRTFRPALELVEQGLCYCVCDPLTAVSYEVNRAGNSSVAFIPFAPAVPYDIALLSPAHRPLSRLASEFYGVMEAEMLRIAERYRVVRV